MISPSGYFGFRRKHWISLFGSKIHNVDGLLLVGGSDKYSAEIWSSLPPPLGRSDVGSSGRVNFMADIFIFGCRDQVDLEWAGRVTRSHVIPHPPYSLDLAPSDFHLFISYKMLWLRNIFSKKIRWRCLWKTSWAEFYWRGINKLPDK